jgi:hypothetical protein
VLRIFSGSQVYRIALATLQIASSTPSNPKTLSDTNVRLDIMMAIIEKNALALFMYIPLALMPPFPTAWQQRVSRPEIKPDIMNVPNIEFHNFAIPKPFVYRVPNLDMK